MNDRNVAPFLVALALLVFALSACSGNSAPGTETNEPGTDRVVENSHPDEPSAPGTYELDKEAVKAAVQAHVNDLPEEERQMAQAMMGMMVGMIDGTTMTITLNEDGSATSSYTFPGEQPEDATGSWTQSGDRVSITLAGEGDEPETQTGTLKDGTITIEDPHQEMMIILRKKGA